MLVYSSTAEVRRWRWWHWCNGVTPRHMNLVNGYGQKWRRCSGPISSGFCGHTQLSFAFGSRGRLFEEHRVVCLESTEWGSMRFYSRTPLVLLQVLHFASLFHYKILFQNVNKLASNLGRRGLIKRKVKGNILLLLIVFRETPHAEEELK